MISLISPPPRSLLIFLFLLRSSALIRSQPPQIGGFFLDCGAAGPSTDDGSGLPWKPDDAFVSSGVSKNLSIPGLLPILSTIRSFPFDLSAGAASRKFCYAIPIVNGARYLVRATYFYGGANGPGTAPPVFDQIVDGTLWTAVDTAADYAANRSSYYEGVFAARKNTMRFCIGANGLTDSDPFISALQFVLLDDSVYNSTDFGSSVMGLVARSSFGGGGGGGAVVRYPDDKFDRYWQPFTDITRDSLGTHNVSASGFWNLPPASVFLTAVVANADEVLGLQWISASLPDASYYIAMYFADIQPESSRTFSVYLNDYMFYNNLEVSSNGIMVFTSQWNISGSLKISLAPGGPGSSSPPLINAAEIFRLFPLGRVTVTRDVIAMESIKASIQNPPDNWEGDPCLPQGYSWAGVTCEEGRLIRVVALNLSSMGLNGSLSGSIGNLTALNTISFSHNNLTGPIPDLGRLKLLNILDLQDNQFIGHIPSSLGDLPNITEIFLQNNNLTGEVPPNLKGKPGLNLTVTPGNNFSPPT